MEDLLAAPDEIPDAKSGRVVRLGVDVGKLQDYTAFAITDSIPRLDGTYYVVRQILREPLGTTYPHIVERIVMAMKRLDVQARRWGGRPDAFARELVVDATGVGQPVIDLIQERGVTPIGVTLTGSDKVVRYGMELSVGKAALVARLQVLLQSRRLILEDDEMGRLMATELESYEIKVSDNGHASFNARSGQHDDLVIALGLSVGFENHQSRLKVESAFPSLETLSRQRNRQRRLERAKSEARNTAWKDIPW